MTATTKNRPSWQAGTIRSASSESSPIVPPLRAAGRVRLDLRRINPDTSTYSTFEAEQEISRILQEVAYAPAGAEVVLEVAKGQLVSISGVARLREMGQHLGPIVVESSDPATVQRWVSAFRGEGLW